MHQNKNKTQIHNPVLVSEVIDILNPRKGDSYLDLTAGYGGHADKVLSLTDNFEESVLVDRDIQSITELKSIFKDGTVKILHTDFLTATKELVEQGKSFDMILADLGVSSLHINEGSRGFSFINEGPLDMRMDQSISLTAEKVVNTYSENDLAEILHKYGEEPKAKMIAREIVHNRPINNTTELADIAKKAWKGYSRTHPATRTFQAIRIYVNDELNLLLESLPNIIRLLKPGGRIAIITFHSLEDRIVKDFFKENSQLGYESEIYLINKKPITPQPNEIVNNPRSRSAKLRGAAKIKT